MAFEYAYRLAALQVPTRSVSSDDPDTARRPSSVTATAVTRSVWPVERVQCFASFRSKSRSVWSHEAETARRPSEVIAKLMTAPLWLLSVRTGCGVELATGETMATALFAVKCSGVRES